MATEIAESPQDAEVNSFLRHRITNPPWFGWAAFAISLAALICGILPHYLFGDPLPNPFERRPNPPPNAQAAGVKVHIGFMKDDVVVEVEEVKEAVREQAADAKGRVVKWGGALKQQLADWRADPARPADALHPENRQQPAPNPAAIEPPVPAAANAPPDAVPAPLAANQPAPWTTSQTLLLTAVLLAIASLPLAMVSWISEKQRPLPVAAIACSTLAVTWQYLVLGLILGMMAAVLIYFLWMFVKIGG